MFPLKVSMHTQYKGVHWTWLKYDCGSYFSCSSSAGLVLDLVIDLSIGDGLYAGGGSVSRPSDEGGVSTSCVLDEY